MRAVSSLTNTGSGSSTIASLSSQASTTCGSTLAAGGSCLLRGPWSARPQSPGVFVSVTTTFTAATVPAASPASLALSGPMTVGSPLSSPLASGGKGADGEGSNP